jgi:hypothetical protein
LNCGGTTLCANTLHDRLARSTNTRNIEARGELLITIGIEIGSSITEPNCEATKPREEKESKE